MMELSLIQILKYIFFWNGYKLFRSFQNALVVFCILPTHTNILTIRCPPSTTYLHTTQECLQHWWENNIAWLDSMCLCNISPTQQKLQLTHSLPVNENGQKRPGKLCRMGPWEIFQPKKEKNVLFVRFGMVFFQHSF